MVGGLIRAFLLSAFELPFITLTKLPFSTLVVIWLLLTGIDIFCLDFRGLGTSALLLIASSTTPILPGQLPLPPLPLVALLHLVN